MKRVKYRIVEVLNLPDGVVINDEVKHVRGNRFIVEYEREGYGVQRPTFFFDEGVKDSEAISEMKKQIDAERKLNDAGDRGQGTKKAKDHSLLDKEF